MDRRDDIIKILEKLSGGYSSYEIFSDWIRLMAFSISNSLSPIHDKLWNDRESSYRETISKYKDRERGMLQKCFSLLVETLEEPSDVLGDVFMRSGMGSQSAGQFFTPFHLSVLTAQAGIDVEELKKTDELIRMNEPSCGGGGMIIATAKVLKEAGIDYQSRMRVIAQDLDWKGVYMTYVQVSLLGIHAWCIQGDSLADSLVKIPREKVLYTPKAAGVLL